MYHILNTSAVKNFCGEAPVWIPEEHTLYWVDTGNKSCFSLEDEGQLGPHRTLPVPGLPQALGIRRNGGWIVPMEDRVVILDKTWNLVEDLGSPLPQDSPLLLGDGTVGPDGCFYFGAYDPEILDSPEGCVFRVNRDLSFEKVLSGFALPNGMAFSPEGDRFYLTEMFARKIWRFTFDAENGNFSRKSLFAELPEEKGYPDGLILDAQGGVYSAHWQGFRVTRYNPDGTVAAEIEVPVPTATCMALGGPELKTLYITTARKGNSEEQERSYPEAGDLFRTEVEVPGLPEREFLG